MFFNPIPENQMNAHFTNWTLPVTTETLYAEDKCFPGDCT